MKNCLLVIIIGCFISSCSHQLAPEGHFQDTPVIADGSTSDWSLPLRFSNEKHTLQYMVTNDDQNIYVCVLSKDNATQMKILKDGMAVYFDPKGENNKKMTLLFPVKKGDDIANENAGLNKNAVKHQLLTESDFYDVAGFANMENGLYGLKDAKSNMHVAIKLDKDSGLVYEAIVPIKNVLGSELTAKKANKNFSVGIEINGALKKVKTMVSQNTNTSTNMGRSMLPHSNGMRGMNGMNGMNNSGRQKIAPVQKEKTVTKEDNNWYQFHLVYKKEGA